MVVERFAALNVDNQTAACGPGAQAWAAGSDGSDAGSPVFKVPPAKSKGIPVAE
jgi:hypothetical protein